MNPDADPDSVKVMTPIDRIKPAFRALVHEYGALIVLRMIADGYDDPSQLRSALETWRERRQQQWLATDYWVKAGNHVTAALE